MKVLRRVRAVPVVLAAGVLLGGCEAKPDEPPAGQAAAESCEVVPTGYTVGSFGDPSAGGDPAIRAGSGLRAEAPVGSEVRVDLTQGAVVPDGTTARVASVERPDIGTAQVCDGRVLVYRTRPGDLQGEVSLRFCLEGSQVFGGCQSVGLTVVDPASVAIRERVRLLTGRDPAPFVLTSQDTRAVMRDSGLTDDGIRRLQALADAVWVKSLTFGDDFGQRIVVAAQCGGLAGVLGEEYAIMGESLGFAVQGMSYLTAEVGAMQGDAPDNSAEVGNQARAVFDRVLEFRETVEASLDPDKRATFAQDKAKAVVKGKALAGVRQLPGGKYVADPKGEFCLWATNQAVELGRDRAGRE